MIHFTAILTAVAVANAAALPHHPPHAGAQVSMSLNDAHAKAEAHERRSIPVAPLPPTVLAKMTAAAGGKHVPGDHHRTQKGDDTKSDGGKKKKGSRSFRLWREAELARRDDLIHIESDGSRGLLGDDAILGENGLLGDGDNLTLTIDKRDAIHKHVHKHNGHHHHHNRDSLPFHTPAYKQDVTLLDVKIGEHDVAKREDHDRDHDHNDDDVHEHEHDHDHDHKRMRRMSRRSPSASSEKRALINLGSSSPQYYYTPATKGSLVHLSIGKRGVSPDASEDAHVQKKRAPFLGQRADPVGSSVAYLVGMASKAASKMVEARDHHHHHHHHHHHNDRRQTTAGTVGVEGVINIVSSTVGATPNVNIASLLLSDDPSAVNSFVLNASNDTATHIFLVPINSTLAAASTDGSMPVSIRVPVYSPADAAMVDYCMTYDPNPPSPSPLTAKSCTEEVTDHVSQVFSYNPANSTIIPMWSAEVTPSSTNATSSSADATSTAESTTSSSASAVAAAVTSASPQKRDVSEYIIKASTQPATQVAASTSEDDASAVEPEDCDDPLDAASTSSVESSISSQGSATPQDISLIFTPSNAAGILSAATSQVQSSSTDGDDGEDDGSDEDPEDDVDPADETKDSTDDGDDNTTSQGVANAATFPTSPNGAVPEDPTDLMTDEAIFTEEEAGAPSSVSSAALPSMTPIPDAVTPYSWIFTPQ